MSKCGQVLPNYDIRQIQAHETGVRNSCYYCCFCFCFFFCFFFFLFFFCCFFVLFFLVVVVVVFFFLLLFFSSSEPNFTGLLLMIPTSKNCTSAYSPLNKGAARALD